MVVMVVTFGFWFWLRKKKILNKKGLPQMEHRSHALPSYLSRDPGDCRVSKGDTGQYSISNILDFKTTL